VIKVFLSWGISYPLPLPFSLETLPPDLKILLCISLHEFPFRVSPLSLNARIQKESLFGPRLKFHPAFDSGAFIPLGATSSLSYPVEVLCVTPIPEAPPSQVVEPYPPLPKQGQAIVPPPPPLCVLVPS